MSRPGADPRSARVAVIGAQSHPGAFIRSALEEHGVPGDRVVLYGATHGEAVISEYDGEARLIQDPDPEQAPAMDVIFLCEPGAGTEEVARRAAAGAVVVDLSDPPAVTGEATLVHPEFLPHEPQGERGTLRIPHYLSIVLAELLEPLQCGPGLAEVVGFVLRPAADYGQQGVEELREQTVRLLNFGKPPKDVFGRQLAFNCIPQHLVDDREAGVESRIAKEVGALLGCEELTLSVRLVTIPVFYGHGLLLRVACNGPADHRRILDSLGEGTGVQVSLAGEGAATPLETSGHAGTIVTSVREDGPNRHWIWAVADEAGAASAKQALNLADSMCDLRGNGTRQGES